MAFNGSGTFLINTAGQPVVPNTTITSTAFNLLTADLANGLTNCVTKDGQTTTSVVIPFAVGIETDSIAELTAGSGVTIEDNLLVAGDTTNINTAVSGSDVNTYSRQQITTGIAQSTTVDLFRFIDATGTLFGNYFAVGHFFVNLIDQADGANNSSFIYKIGTVGDGNVTASIVNELVVRRGTTLDSSFQLASDGGSGAAKLTLTTAASGKTITAYTSFIGYVK